MRILVIGANGQLGSDLTSLLERKGENVIPAYHTYIGGVNIDIASEENVFSVFEAYRPGVVINTAAFHNVDLCEEQPERAFLVNAIGPKNLAEASKKYNSFIIHFSTDYVFDGFLDVGKEYSEEDLPNPLNTYGKSKLEGEKMINDIMDNNKFLILRVQALQGISKSSVKGTNFIEKMIKTGEEKGLVKVVSDQITKPSFTRYLSELIYFLIRNEMSGTYHLANGGTACSWYFFAKEIFNKLKMNVECIPINTNEASQLFNYRARRPLNTALSTKKIEKELGIKLKPWEESLEEYLRRRKNGI